MIKVTSPGYLRHSLYRDRRGVVAMWVAVTTPVIAMGLGLGVDVTEWVIANQQLQRAADSAATAGALKYGTLQDAQKAANIAADVAEANGASGSASRTWTTATKTLVSNNITVVVANAITNGNNVSVAVQVKKSVVPTFGKIFSSSDKIISSSATADSTGTVTTFQQPCLFAMGTLSTSTVDIAFSGSGNVQMPNCSIVSNELIALTGSFTLNAGTAYAKGAITKSSSSSWGSTVRVPDTTINFVDPYASSAALSTAFSKLADAITAGTTSVSGSGTVTLSPGIYSSLSINGSPRITFQSGLYVIKGAMSIGGSPIISGSNVTFINGSTLTIGGSPVLSLTAPTTASAGSIAGILFASNINNTSNNLLQLTGSSGMVLTGMFYFPKTNVLITGSPSANGSSGCLEIIGNIITVSGSPMMANAGCPAMGVLNVTSSNGATVGAKLQL